MLRAIALSLLLGACAVAQVGSVNISPSVTSPMHRGITGPLPSVTSIPPGTSSWHSGFRFGHPHFGFKTGRHHRPFVNSFPYFSGYPVYPYPAYGSQPTVVVIENDSDYEPPAMTVFERRERSAIRDSEYADDGRYGEHYLDDRDRGSSDSSRKGPPKAQVIDVYNEPNTVLIFRDGHKLEIANYAIMNGTVINLGKGPRRIQIADLDLKATIKANDDRGIAFYVPQ